MIGTVRRDIGGDFHENGIANMHAAWKIVCCLLFFLLLPAIAVCAELGDGKTGVQDTKAVSNALIRNDVKKAKKRKKSDMNDPEKLREIAEKTILSIQSPGGDSDNNLDLPVKGRISSTVGLRQDPINGDIRMHNGIDIAIAEGTPVRPVAPGRVAYSGMQPGYGNMVIVQHDDGMISIYAHHLRNLVKSGERATKESVVAYSGSTGHSTGPHLHFEAWQAGKNVTSAFLPSFAGRKIEASSHISLEKTNLRKAIMSDGTILYIEIAANKK
jgi:murein DD-endopeptidase MepM/ murein hydrolase activator NlpD